MPWYVPWSENIKKRACRYLLQRYLGQFLEEKLTLDQLNVDLYNGTGTVSDVSLDCEALNELGEAQGWPVEFVDGFVQQMTVSIPWATLLQDDSIVQVSGLVLTLQPRQRSQSATSMLESMWSSSMTSSMQLAAECLKQEGDSVAAPQPVEGIELFAQTIDSILCRVKVKFSNTTIRMEHVPKDSSTGVALEIRIKNIDYLDEAGADPPTEVMEEEKGKTYVVSTFTTKRIAFEGVTFHTDEFPSKARTFSRSVIAESDLVKSRSFTESEIPDILFESCNSVLLPESDKKKAEATIEDDKEIPPEERVSGGVVFGRLAGRQELRLRLKQASEAPGPRVELSLTLGSLTVFLSPRQLLTLTELAEGLASPHLQDTSNVPLRGRAGLECKPMQRLDFERVEAQLLGELASERSAPSLSARHGWSTANIDDSDGEEEQFLPLASRHETCVMSDSVGSSMSSSVMSNASSLGSMGLRQDARRRRAFPQMDGDPSAEVSQVHVRVASVACILLHEDILAVSSSLEGELSAESVRRLRCAAEDFFSRLGLFAVTGYGSLELNRAAQAFDEAVSFNHLRLLAAPLVLEGTERCGSQGSCLSGQLTTARLDLRECLPSSSITIPLLTFAASEQKCSQKDSTEQTGCDSEFLNPLGRAPDMKITFKNLQKASKVGAERKYSQPRTEISVALQACTVEVDVSLVDRMSALFRPQPPCRCPAAEPALYTDSADHHFQASLVCPKLRIKLRFPIADLRPAHDMSRLPWWQRGVRPDFLLAELLQASLSTSSTHSLDPTTLIVKCRLLDLYYVESENDPEIHLGQAGIDSKGDGSESTTDWPSVTITVLPHHESQSVNLDSSSEGEQSEQPVASQSMGQSMGQSSAMLMDRLGGRPGPFSAKKMVHESDTPHGKNNEDDTEELVIPGDAAEMADFASFSLRNSLLQVECNLPVVSLQLNSKRLYEVLYNRINSDLLLWEPSAPGQRLVPGAPEPGLLAATQPAFSMCKSGINYNSDSDSASSSTDSNIYYSVYDHRAKQSGRSKSIQKSTNRKERAGRMNNLCFHLQIGKGILTLHTPVRDAAGLVLPSQQGELALSVGGLALCHVSGVGGNTRSALISLQATTAHLSHCGLVPIPSESPPLRLYGCSLPEHLRSTVYPTESGLHVPHNGNTAGRGLLGIAISVRPNKDYPKFKTVRVAVGVSCATLRHVMSASQHGVLSQALDMLDVCDYPVPGYEPSTVVTELHVHLWECAIDYRPLNLPLRTVLTMGSFSVASNVVAGSAACSLRFIAEECALFLGTGTPTRPNLQQHYCQVLDLGLFELSLRLNDKNISTAPRVDLRASNNVVHVRTCSDSLRALCRLICYVAADGDLVPAPSAAAASTGPDGEIPATETSVERPPEEIRDLSKSQVQQVNDLMAEAMKESINLEDMSSTESPGGVGEGVEIFFFPDESKASRPRSSASSSLTDLSSAPFQECNAAHLDSTTEAECNVDSHATDFLSDEAVNELSLEPQERGPDAVPMAVVARELGDFSQKLAEKPARAVPKMARKGRKSSSDNTDEEFCVVGEECLGAGEQPELRWLCAEPLSLIDNHFAVPVGKTDLLKPPKNFPMAVLRYTLCEMTLVWHMYGGSDFSEEGVATAGASQGPVRKSVTISDGARHSPTHRERDPYSVLPKSPPAVSGRYGAGLYTGGVAYSKGSEVVTEARTPNSPRSLSWRHRGGPNRRHDVLMELQLNKVRFQHETYPAGGAEASRQVLVIASVEIRDRLASSQINKFLYQYTSDQRPRRKHANMVVIKAVHLRPDPRLAAQECCLKVSLLPLRFNIDQDALLFLVGFFGQLGDADLSKEPGLTSTLSGSSQSLHSGSGSRHSTPTHQPPVMSVAPRPTSDPMLTSECGSEDSLSLRDDDEGGNPLINSYEAERLVSENLILLEEDWRGPRRRGSSVGPTAPEPTDDAPIYFRSVVFSPEVPIRLDYQGKRVDLTHGPLAGLLMGLAQLNCSELRLKRLSYRHGLLGLERLLKWALQEWLGDIKRHQLPGLLGGVGPMYSLVQLFQGIRDLFWLPIEQYQRDGRLVRGLQRGASSFTTSTAMAALDITARIIHLIQATAETAYDMVSPSPGLRGARCRGRRRRERARQPQDLREGVTNAYHLFREGLGETAQTLADVAVAERSARGYSGAVGGLLRQLPPTALAPLLLASEAAARVLGGVRAHLAPAEHRDHSDKWRADWEPPSD